VSRQDPDKEIDHGLLAALLKGAHAAAYKTSTCRSAPLAVIKQEGMVTPCHLATTTSRSSLSLTTSRSSLSLPPKVSVSEKHTDPSFIISSAQLKMFEVQCLKQVTPGDITSSRKCIMECFPEMNDGPYHIAHGGKATRASRDPLYGALVKLFGEEKYPEHRWAFDYLKFFRNRRYFRQSYTKVCQSFPLLSSVTLSFICRVRSPPPALVNLVRSLCSLLLRVRRLRTERHLPPVPPAFGYVDPSATPLDVMAVLAGDTSTLEPAKVCACVCV
jgi:hypothetical protein